MNRLREKPNRTQQLSNIRVRDRSSGKLIHLEVVQQNFFKKDTKKRKKDQCRKELHKSIQRFLEFLLNTRPGKGQMKFSMDKQKERRKRGEGREKNEENTDRYQGVYDKHCQEPRKGRDIFKGPKWRVLGGFLGNSAKINTTQILRMKAGLTKL